MSDFVFACHALRPQRRGQHRLSDDGGRTRRHHHGPGHDLACRILTRVPGLYGLLAPSFNVRPRRHVDEFRTLDGLRKWLERVIN